MKLGYNMNKAGTHHGSSKDTYFTHIKCSIRYNMIRSLLILKYSCIIDNNVDNVSLIKKEKHLNECMIHVDGLILNALSARCQQ